MPIYEYQCTQCGNRVEALQKLSDPPLEVCDACGGAMKRLVSSPAFQFKGSGWYVTDYARKGGKSESAKSESAKSESAKGDSANNDSAAAESKAGESKGGEAKETKSGAAGGTGSAGGSGSGSVSGSSSGSGTGSGS